jgi:hypothetical protein
MSHASISFENFLRVKTIDDGAVDAASVSVSSPSKMSGQEYARSLLVDCVGSTGSLTSMNVFFVVTSMLAVTNGKSLLLRCQKNFENRIFHAGKRG